MIVERNCPCHTADACVTWPHFDEVSGDLGIYYFVQKLQVSAKPNITWLSTRAGVGLKVQALLVQKRRQVVKIPACANVAPKHPILAPSHVIKDWITAVGRSTSGAATAASRNWSHSEVEQHCLETKNRYLLDAVVTQEFSQLYVFAFSLKSKNSKFCW